MSFIPNFNQKVTITSSTSWTCPAGVFWALFTIWAGGGGGYILSDGSTYTYTSGGGGAQWKQLMIPVTPGVTYNFVIASGGTGYVNFSNVSGSATAGGNSYCYTATAQTTLAAAISGTGNGNIDLTAVTGITGGAVIQIDSEMMLVLNPGTAGGTNTYVIRGYLGTTAATHSNSATVNLISVVAFVLGGSPGSAASGGNGGGADGSSGGGANNSNTSGAGAGKPAQNGRGGTGAGGGAFSNLGGSSFTGVPGGATESPLGFGFPTTLGFSGFGPPTLVSGGASWGPGNPGGDYSATVTSTPAPNTGGGGGSGAAGSSGGALVAYQAA